jgi:hypothetical protein
MKNKIILTSLFIVLISGFVSCYVHENLDTGYTTYGWTPDENNIEEVSIIYDYDIFPSYENFNYSLLEYYHGSFETSRYWNREYYNKNNMSYSWNPNWIYSFYKKDKYNEPKIWWENPKNFTEKNKEFKIFAERYDFQLDAPKTHKLTILNNLLINDIYNNLSTYQSLETKNIESKYFKNNELILTNKENKSTIISPLDRLYIGGELGWDFQNTRIFLNAIEPRDSDKIVIKGDLGVDGQVCDKNGCIGANNCEKQGSWCGICNVEEKLNNNSLKKINKIPCGGYNVCDECPKGYSKENIENFNNNPKRYMIVCIKD